MTLETYLKQFPYVEIVRVQQAGDVVQVHFRVKDSSAWLVKGKVVDSGPDLAKLFEDLDDSKLRVCQHFFTRDGKLGYLWNVFYSGTFGQVESEEEDEVFEVPTIKATTASTEVLPSWAKGSKITNKRVKAFSGGDPR